MQDDITPTPQPKQPEPTQPYEPTSATPDAPTGPDAFAAPVAESSVEPTTDPVIGSSADAMTTSTGPIGSGENSPLAATPVSPTPQPGNGMGNKKKKLLIGGIIAGALLILGGGGAAAYNLWYQNPDKVLGDALVNAVSARSVVFTSTIDVNLNESSSSLQGLPTKVSVKLDGQGSYDSGSQLDVKLETQLNKKDITLSGSGIVDKDQNIYVKVNDVKKTIDDFGVGASMPSEYESVIDSVDGKWIKISSEDIKEQSKDLAEAQTCINDAVKKLSDNRSQTNELLNLYKDNAFVVVEDELGSKDGSLGYAINFDEDKAKSFGDGLKDTAIYKELDKCDTSATDDIASDFAPSPSDSSNNNDDNTTYEVWVSRFGHQLTSFKVSSKPTDKTNSLKSAEFVFSPEFDKPVNVSAPSDSIELSKVIKDFEAAQEKYTQRVYSQYSTNSARSLQSSQLGAPLSSDSVNIPVLPSL